MSYLVQEVFAMGISQSYFKNDSVYGNLSRNPRNGTIGCGFLFKPDASYSQSLCFEHYGAFYLLSGKGMYRDESGRETPVYAGDYVQRLPDVPHSTTVYPTGDWLEFFICFGAETYEHLADLNLLSREPVIHPGLSTILFKKCAYLLAYMKNGSGDRQPFLYLQLQEFAMELYQHSLHKQMGLGVQRLMQKASELLCTPPEFKSPHEVAALLDMGYENFRKKFKAYFHDSPSVYQLNARINYSKTLLLDTKKSLNEIALLCHFSDAFAYSKAFKKYYGIAPSLFRQMYLP